MMLLEWKKDFSPQEDGSVSADTCVPRSVAQQSIRDRVGSSDAGAVARRSFRCLKLNCERMPWSRSRTLVALSPNVLSSCTTGIVSLATPPFVTRTALRPTQPFRGIRHRRTRYHVLLRVRFCLFPSHRLGSLSNKWELLRARPSLIDADVACMPMKRRRYVCLDDRSHGRFRETAESKRQVWLSFL